MTNNWQNIHPEFSKNRLWSEYFQWQWTSNSFNYQQTKDWIDADLRPWEHEIAWWLVNIKNQAPTSLTRENIEVFKKNYYLVEKKIPWLKRGFSEEEIQQWINRGLNLQEVNLANYLKTNNLTLSKELKQNYYQAQTWLDLNYPLVTRNEVKELAIVNFNLQGSLQLEDFPNLEGFYCADNQLTSLTVINCPQLKIVLCNRNNLTNLTLLNCPNLTKLVANRNQLTSLDFLQNLIPEKLEILNISGNNISENDLTPFRDFTNLQHLGLGNWYKESVRQGIYNRFSGSLELLANINYLEELDLAGTDVDSGWESLPASIQTLYLFSKERPDSQVKLIAEQLRQYGETAKDRHEDDNFASLLTKYKTEQKIQELEKENQQFIKQQKEISYLELRVNELTNLVNNQKAKIINSFLRLFPEKNLLQKLITIHLELTKFKKQAIGTSNYRKQCRQYENDCHRLEDELEELLLINGSNQDQVEEKMDNIKAILTDCEELVSQELELEQKLTNKSQLIEDQKQNSLLQLTSEEVIEQITKHKKDLTVKENINQQQLHEFYLQQQDSLLTKISLTVSETVEQKLTSQQNFLTKFINKLAVQQIISEKEQTVIQKIKNLLSAKQAFLTARQETIQELRSVCDQLENTLIKGKYAHNEELAKALTATGKVAGCWTFNLIEATGQATELTNSHFKRLFTIKQGQQFQIALKDEPEIQELEQVYQELLVLFNEEAPLFTTDYKIYQVITNIWEGKAHIDVSDMKDALSLLTANFKLLDKELKDQEKVLQKVDSNFVITNQKLTQNKNQESRLQTEIKRLQSQLEGLVISAKNKLVSKKVFNKEQITQEREQLLQLLLNIQEKVIHNPLNIGNIFILNKELTVIKEQLGKKLTVTDFNNLYRTQAELNNLQTELKDLQNQQQQQL